MEHSETNREAEMDITRYMREQENPTLTADSPDHAMQMLRMSIVAALEVMTHSEVANYCADYCDRMWVALEDESPDTNDRGN
jgi:hypothetical protein